MSFTYILIVLFIIYLSIKLFQSSKGRNEIRKKSTFEIPDIAGEYKVYEFEDNDEFFVHGVQARAKNVIDWAKGKNLSIYAKREPLNKFDSNAIAIYGQSSNKKRKIGYIATEIAEELVDKGYDKKLKVQLLDVKINNNTDAELEFDLNIFIEYKILIPLT